MLDYLLVLMYILTILLPIHMALFLGTLRRERRIRRLMVSYWRLRR